MNNNASQCTWHMYAVYINRLLASSHSAQTSIMNVNGYDHVEIEGILLHVPLLPEVGLSRLISLSFARFPC
jgi:hypothetical protein